LQIACCSHFFVTCILRARLYFQQPLSPSPLYSHSVSLPALRSPHMTSLYAITIGDHPPARPGIRRPHRHQPLPVSRGMIPDFFCPPVARPQDTPTL
jgi:hypothetical protein